MSAPGLGWAGLTLGEGGGKVGKLDVEPVLATGYGSEG